MGAFVANMRRGRAVRLLALHCASICALGLSHAQAQDTSPFTRQASGAAGTWQQFTVNIPEGTAALNVVLSGSTGDADLYVRAGEDPNATTFDCRPFLDGSNETCTVTNPKAGAWHIGINGFTDYSDATLNVTWADSKGAVTPETPPGGTNNSFMQAVEGAAGSWKRFNIDVPAGSTSLTVTLTGAMGDADLYIRAGEDPTESAFDCRPFLDSVDETCTIANPKAGSWHLGVNGFTAYSGATLKATWTAGNTGGQQQPPTTMTPPTGDWKTNVLNKHNEFRANHCAPAMTWDDEVAAAAQTYANACNFGHDPNNNLGENIAAGSEQPTEMWYSEVSDYNFANPGFTTSTGHFTQVVWRGSTKLGCGRAECGFGVYYVCRYSPAGNNTGAGQFEANVLPAGATCP